MIGPALVLLATVYYAMWNDAHDNRYRAIDNSYNKMLAEIQFVELTQGPFLSPETIARHVRVRQSAAKHFEMRDKIIEVQKNASRAMSQADAARRDAAEVRNQVRLRLEKIRRLPQGPVLPVRK